MAKAIYIALNGRLTVAQIVDIEGWGVRTAPTCGEDRLVPKVHTFGKCFASAGGM